MGLKEHGPKGMVHSLWPIRLRGLSLFILIQVAILLLGGCSLFGLGGDKPRPSAEELLSDGIAAFEDGDYTRAATAFQDLKDRYPYSTLAVQAELKLADALFKREQFEEALEAYREFETLHPKNTSVPYAIYQQGMCNFLRMNAIDRDQTSTKSALQEFERLRREFPTSPFSLMAVRRIRRCLINLAEYEFSVGHFYFKTGYYLAALRRFEYLIAHYPDYGQYEKTLTYITKCREKLAQQEPAP
jgi:outer membrane protein assembly factor BamD